MSFNTQVKLAFRSLAVAGFIITGVLSGCGGGGDTNGGSGDTPGTPSTSTTYLERVGIDVKLFNGYRSGLLKDISIDTNANLTFTYNNDSISPIDNYNFTFPSGLAGGSASGNFFTLTEGAIHKEINILTPQVTKTVQNVFWRDTVDPSLFGFGLAGYMSYPVDQKLPQNGTITFTGKAFHYIVDSNRSVPDQTTYALYVSDVTARADYSTNTFSIAIAPSPTFINAIGEPDALNLDPAQFAAEYTVTNMDVFGISTQNQDTWSNPPISGMGLKVKNGMLAHFGSKAEELAGFITYSGPALSGYVTRDQYISFALTKQ